MRGLLAAGRQPLGSRGVGSLLQCLLCLQLWCQLCSQLLAVGPLQATLWLFKVAVQCAAWTVQCAVPTLLPVPRHRIQASC